VIPSGRIKALSFGPCRRAIAVVLGRRVQSLDRFGEPKVRFHVLDSNADRLPFVDAGHEEREPLDTGDTVAL